MNTKLIFFLGIFVLAIAFNSQAQNKQKETATPIAEKKPDSIYQDGMIPSLKFKEADINIVLQAIAQKASKDGKQVNIIIAPEVEGAVTVDLKNVYWLTALDAVLKIYDYSYEWIGEDIIMITTLERLAEKREKETLAAQQEPLATIAYKLIFLDARDVERMVKPQLTARGRITVLETEEQKGWIARGGFSAGGSASASSTGEFGRAQRESGAKPRTNRLIITDTKSNLRAILDAIKAVDIMPKQVMIKTKIIEVNRDKLKDIGFDYGTGTAGVTGSLSEVAVNARNTKRMTGLTTGDVTPSIFGPKSEDISGVIPYNAGTQFIFRKYSGTEFEIVMHALEEDVRTNTLSEPSILTLDGKEAYIMVGEKRPVVESSITSSETSVGINKNLSYYQNLGIELNVVPQICGKDFINLIVYPSVTSSSENVDATSQIGSTTSTDSYPIIRVRETQTQVLLNNGETIAIGGLLKDVKSEGIIKTPILGDIPLLGKLFQRKTNDTEKIDLLIFITVQIIDPAAKMAHSTETITAATSIDGELKGAENH